MLERLTIVQPPQIVEAVKQIVGFGTCING
jgi:hypothetical protein